MWRGVVLQEIAENHVEDLQWCSREGEPNDQYRSMMLEKRLIAVGFQGVL